MTQPDELPSSPSHQHHRGSGSGGTIQHLKNRLSFRNKQRFREGVANLTIEMRLLSQTEALSLDKDLYEEYNFSADQIAELAGLSVATAIARMYPIAQMVHKGTILVVCGPGNNGRDGLVCARHLKLFGYNPSIFYPKPSSNPLMKMLVHQIEASEISALGYLPDPTLISHSYNLVVDAVFGINYIPPARDPFVDTLDRLRKVTIPIVSVDIPSGWDVNNGPIDEANSLKPEVLISLSAPKKCAGQFRGKAHFLGGRFIPNSLAHKYNLHLPTYPGTEQIVEFDT